MNHLLNLLHLVICRVLCLVVVGVVVVVVVVVHVSRRDNQGALNCVCCSFTFLSLFVFLYCIALNCPQYFLQLEIFQTLARMSLKCGLDLQDWKQILFFSRTQICQMSGRKYYN